MGKHCNRNTESFTRCYNPIFIEQQSGILQSIHINEGVDTSFKLNRKICGLITQKKALNKTIKKCMSDITKYENK